MRIALSVRVYYSLDHLLPKYGGGCSHKWELQCMYMYNIPLITYFPNTEELLTAIRIAMYMCILFLWSHMSTKWKGLLKEMRIAKSVCVYYSLDHLFSRHGWGCSQNLELQCLYVYIIPLVFPQAWRGIFREMRIALSVRVYYSLDHLLPKYGGGCSHKWELQCMYMYNIPLITYFPNTEELLTAIRIAMYMCILFLWSHMSPTWKGLLKEMRIAKSLCVYYSLDHLFPQHGGVARSNENCNVCMYIIPLIPYLPDREGVAERN